MIVSHDRYFLNRVVTKVIEVDQAHIRMYMGNYKAYAAKKQQIRDARLKEYMNQQREIKHQQAVIEKLRSFNREKSIKRAESREKMLDRITPVEKPVESVREMHFSLEPSCISGSDVLTVEHLSKRFDSQQLFQDISFEIHRGEHVAIIGDNGTGKTTLLKIINQVVSADKGSFTLGSNVKIGYYDQEHQLLHMEKTIFEEISDAYPGLNNTKIRNVLAAFLFTNDDVFKHISDLSGGERGRVSLAKLMLSDANFLILDEPTNHLDIYTRESLGAALASYEGTLVLVTHDRYLMNSLACPILFIENGKTSLYEDYDAMMHRGAVPPEKNIAPEKTASAGKAAYGKDIDSARVTDVEELGGHGVTAKVDGKLVAAGNARLMAKLGLTVPDVPQTGTIVHVAIDGKYAGYLLISDVVKPHSAQAIKGLKQAGVRKTVMLTGDAEPVAKAVSAELGIDEYHAGLLPGDKVDQIEKLLAAKKPKEMLAFVGDGINDAPVLSRVDVGIAMGALGSDAAIEAADVVLMDDDPAKIALAMRIARRTKSIVYQNIVFALAIKAACLLLGALGIANMWAAIFADVGVMVLAVLNATRALYTKNLTQK